MAITLSFAGGASFFFAFSSAALAGSSPGLGSASGTVPVIRAASA